MDLKMIKWFVEKIYHYSTSLTSWSWTWLYGKRKVNKPKGLIRLNKMRVYYYKSLLSERQKKYSFVEEIIKEKLGNGKKRKMGRKI